MLKILRRLAVAILVIDLAAAPFIVAAHAQGPVSVSALVRDLSGAVVNIGTTRRLPSGRGLPFPDAPEGSPLNELFDERNPNRGGDEDDLAEARSLGSGFVISPDGLIVTNNHVIEEADEIVVFLSDGTRLEAEIAGTDDKTDLAVLRVQHDVPLAFVEFGNSDTAEVGDWVMAIGNPFGLGGSVTLGIVSARNRNINSGPYDNFIQTDAAINQGNSGGPLFDMNGKVVGINTAILARGGGGLGIGFAVPGNLAKPVIDQLAEFGETRRGWLGVGIQTVSTEIALSLGRENANGALVVDVTRLGPSDGILEDGDLILEFDGRQIVEMRDLPRYVAETAVGKRVPVRVLRGGEEQIFDVELGRLETGEQLIADASARDDVPVEEPSVSLEADLRSLVGIEVGAIDPEQRAEYGIVDDVRGVLITDVARGSNAAEKGLLAGLVIEEVNQREVATVDELEVLVDEAVEAERPAILFKVADPTGTRRYVAVRLR